MLTSPSTFRYIKIWGVQPPNSCKHYIITSYIVPYYNLCNCMHSSVLFSSLSFFHFVESNKITIESLLAISDVVHLKQLFRSYPAVCDVWMNTIYDVMLNLVMPIPRDVYMVA